MNTENLKTVIVVPARYASTRLPGKPLADICGKPMIQHVYERACKVPYIDDVIVAVDDRRVAEVVESFGGKVIMTSTQHDSGTDRLVEVMGKYAADIYINIQGDEPLIRSEDIALLAQGMKDEQISVGTLCHALPASEATNPNTVKVVLSANGNALYFSRSPIPYPRDKEHAYYFKHIGVYAYRKETLAKYSNLKQPDIELSEKLEQLRLLDAGIDIRVFEVPETGPGVDTPECLERVRAIMSGQLPIDKHSVNLADIRLVITDVDGVLTDGGIFYNENGECLKRFHVRDGLGIRLLGESGIKVAVLSGRDSPTLRKRIDDLGISYYQLGIKDKHAACIELMQEANCLKEQTAYIGDDTIDLPAFSACGLSFAVADTPEYIRNQADITLTLPGGYGAFRELADKILAAQGKEDVFSSEAGFAQVMHGANQ